MEQQVQVLPDEGGVRVIVCGGEFDQDTLGPLREACAAAADDPGVRRIVLDVAKVTFVDSSMLNQMLLVRRTGRLVLAGPLPHQLDRLLDLTAARDLFATVEGIDAARTL
ncbi:STAS domain-containing protein [Streptomyces subrutilus]|uniref:STAS domain-containing protein n=1 Tax=Streptomyces subrutilus TaxID=36818 RepID=UPI0033EB6646